MSEGFDFTTSDVQDWEIEAIWAAIDTDTLIISRHAQNEFTMDALTLDDVLDTIAGYDEVSKDLPGGTRAPGLNFDRHLNTVTIRVKVGWRDVYYVVVTVMAN